MLPTFIFALLLSWSLDSVTGVHYGSFETNTSGAIYIFAEISRHLKRGIHNPLGRTCTSSRAGTQLCDSIHRQWIKREFAELLNQTIITVDNLLDLSIMFVDFIEGIAESAISDLSCNRFDNPELPLVWKGVTMKDYQPFLVFILREQWPAPTTFCCKSRLLNMAILTVFAYPNIHNPDDYGFIMQALPAEICHVLCCNPYLETSFHPNDGYVDQGHLSGQDISCLLLNGTITLFDEKWCLDKSWARLVGQESCFRMTIKFRKIVLGICGFCYVMGAIYLYTKHQDTGVIITIAVLAVLFFACACLG